MAVLLVTATAAAKTASAVAISMRIVVASRLYLRMVYVEVKRSRLASALLMESAALLTGIGKSSLTCIRLVCSLAYDFAVVIRRITVKWMRVASLTGGLASKGLMKLCVDGKGIRKGFGRRSSPWVIINWNQCLISWFKYSSSITMVSSPQPNLFLLTPQHPVLKPWYHPRVRRDVVVGVRANYGNTPSYA